MKKTSKKNSSNVIVNMACRLMTQPVVMKMVDKMMAVAAKKLRGKTIAISTIRNGKLKDGVIVSL